MKQYTYSPVSIQVNEEVEAFLERSWWARFCIRRMQKWGTRLLNSINANCEPVGLFTDTKQ